MVDLIVVRIVFAACIVKQLMGDERLILVVRLPSVCDALLYNVWEKVGMSDVSAG